MLRNLVTAVDARPVRDSGWSRGLGMRACQCPQGRQEPQESGLGVPSKSCCQPFALFSPNRGGFLHVLHSRALVTDCTRE